MCAVNNNLVLHCAECEDDIKHTYWEAEPENQLSEVWICDRCGNFVYKGDIEP